MTMARSALSSSFQPTETKTRRTMRSTDPSICIPDPIIVKAYNLALSLGVEYLTALAIVQAKEVK